MVVAAPRVTICQFALDASLALGEWQLVITFINDGTYKLTITMTTTCVS
jgi:hypothetical protein